MRRLSGKMGSPYPCDHQRAVTPQTVADPERPGEYTALEIAERSAVLPDDLNQTVGVPCCCLHMKVRVSHLGRRKSSELSTLATSRLKSKTLRAGDHSTCATEVALHSHDQRSWRAFWYRRAGTTARSFSYTSTRSLEYWGNDLSR